MAAKKYRDMKVGESFTVDGSCKITVERKSGGRVRLMIETDNTVQFETKAHMCRESLVKEGDSHGTN